MAKAPSVHRSKARPDPIYVEPSDPFAARNESCKYLDKGYGRVGVREGFVMVPKQGACVIILFPKYHGTRL